MSAEFEARYFSRCLSCGQQIEPGDTAKWDGDDVIHASCPAAAGDQLAAVRPICSTCFMEPSVTGECGCD